ncbi:MAG: MurR/RpiR family transcriptional regulator [Faecalibacterium sp.]
MTFEERIYQQEFKLNDTDDSVIAYIRDNRSDLQNLSIQNIAKELYVAPNAIMRVAKKLGYSGFSELKFSLQQEDNPADLQTVEKRVLDKIPQNIVKTLDVMDEAEMAQLVNTMLSAPKIVFAGVGESVYFCELFGKYLRCLDRKVEYYMHIHDMEYAVTHCQAGDLLLIISASGNTERLVALAKNAKLAGLNTACITHYGKNKLSEMCDAQLCFWGEKRIAGGYNVTDRSGLMMLIRLVSEAYWKKLCV